MSVGKLLVANQSKQQSHRLHLRNSDSKRRSIARWSAEVSCMGAYCQQNLSNITVAMLRFHIQSKQDDLSKQVCALGSSLIYVDWI